MSTESSSKPAQQGASAPSKEKHQQQRSRSRFVKKSIGQAPKKEARSLDSNEDVPMLRYGPGNNFTVFKDRVSTACLEKFGDLGRLILLEEYYEPAQIKDQDYMEPQDPQDESSPKILSEAAKEQLKADVKERAVQLSKMRADRPRMFAYLLSKLSKESLDELKRHEDYHQVEIQVCPLSLWKLIKDIHLVSTPSRIDVVVRRRAYDDYAKCKQGAFESIADFKERHDMIYEAYEAQGNPPRSEEDQAMDFLESLDRGLYGEFICEIINDVAKKTMNVPQTKNEVYVLATTRVVPRKATGNRAIGATYATIEDTRQQQSKPKAKSQGRKGGKSKSTNHKNQQKEASARSQDQGKENPKKGNCYNCGKPGHFARDCPEDLADADGGDEPISAMTLYDGVEDSGPPSQGEHWCYFGGKRLKLGPGDVILDNGSEVDIVHHKFLVNIRPGESGFKGLHGKGKKTSEIGYLPGFYECIACNDTHASVLSQSNVEALYKITYEQGSRYIVHMDDRDLVFRKKGKLYVADMTDWIANDEYYALNTVAERELRYSKREVSMARMARQFIVNSGYPSQLEAIHLVRDGNIENLPISVQDVKNAFAMYGDHMPAFYKGKMTERKAPGVGYWKLDRGLKEERKMQTFVTDVMTVEGHNFLLSISSPLELLLQSHVKVQTSEALGQALQAQINVVRSYGFDVELVRVDPQKALAKLRGSFPGIEIDVAGAGDHLAKVDAKIRRLKETCRAILHGLPYSLPAELIPELVVYAVSRKNVARATALNSNVCPRTKLTGRKVQYKREFMMGFGDYCEAWNPRCKKNSMTARSESCIALYPSTNISGSWILYNIETQRQVRRSNLKKLPVTDRIISIMNQRAAERNATKGEVEPQPIQNRNQEQEIPFSEENEPVIVPRQAPNLNSTTESEAIARDDEAGAADQDYVIIDQRGGDDEQVIRHGGDTEEVSENDPNQMHQNNTHESSEDHEVVVISEEDGVEVQETFEDVIDQYDEDPADWVRVDDPELEELDQEELQEENRHMIRRSARIAAGSRRNPDPNFHYSFSQFSVKEGLRRHGNFAKEATVSEFVNLFRKKKALVPVLKKNLTKTQLKKIIRSSMFLKEKFDAFGNFEKLKGRLVGDGRMQDRSLYQNLKSPTGKLESIVVCLLLACKRKQHLGKIDVGGAYLNAKIGEGDEVFMEISKHITEILVEAMPELKQFVTDKGTMIVQIIKALYGLVQSAALWYDELTAFLKSQGFESNPLDPCVMNKLVGSRMITIILYVDDILVMSEQKEDIQWLIKILTDKWEEVTVETGRKFTYLGMGVKVRDDHICLSMAKYIDDILEVYFGAEGMKCIRTYATPAAGDLFEEPEGELLNESMKKKFHTIVAMLLYLSKRTRIDIQLATLFLCTRVREPSESDKKKLERILGYLKRTRSKNRILSCCVPNMRRLVSYVDASFAVHYDAKGHSGLVSVYQGCIIDTECGKQKIATKDSTESEIVALSDKLSKIHKTQDFLRFQGETLEGVPIIFQDNSSVMTLVRKAGGNFMRTKHLEARRAIIHEQVVVERSVKMMYMNTLDMVADILTKPLGGELFYKFADTLMGWKVPNLKEHLKRFIKNKDTNDNNDQA